MIINFLYSCVFPVLIFQHKATIMNFLSELNLPCIFPFKHDNNYLHPFRAYCLCIFHFKYTITIIMYFL